MTDAQTQLFKHLEKVIYSEATPPTYIRLSYEELHNFDEAGKEIAHYPNPGGKRAFCGVPVIGPNDHEPKESASREPLLSAKELTRLMLMDMQSINLSTFGKEGPACAAIAVRDFYESQITNGKLKVVEEVTMIRSEHSFCVFCSKCGSDGGFEHFYALNYAKCCPGCGNPIKAE